MIDLMQYQFMTKEMRMCLFTFVKIDTPSIVFLE